MAVALTTVVASSLAAQHEYIREAGQKPTNSAGAFLVTENIHNVDYCFQQCDNATGSKHGPCAGFTLLNASGTYLCAFYHLANHLSPPIPTEPDLIAFFKQGAAGPSPTPPPPLPPPPPPVPPPTPPPRAPENFLCTIITDVNGGESIVLNVTRSLAPIGVDHFYMLAKIGFYNNSAFIRYVPQSMVSWGVSGNATDNRDFGHTPIANDPVKGSNTFGTMSFELSPQFKLRATQLFINFADNSHLDSQGYAQFATVVGAGMKTALGIHNPTPNNTHGVPPGEYANGGNKWVRENYPGISFIIGLELSA